MGFDEWFEKNGELYREPTSEERYLFEAGAASQQAEIDELQKRIDDALRTIEPSDEITHSLYRKVYKILKGEK